MNWFDIPLWLSLPFLFVLGAVVGSFLNVCIYRFPQHETLPHQLRGLWTPAWSFCPGCKQKIPRFDNVPILGWLFLLGRCRQCRQRISFRYPLIELLNGVLFVVVYLCEMPDDVRRGLAGGCLYSPMGPQTVSVWKDAAWLHWRYLYHLFLLESLVVATFIDLDAMIIPDGATVPAMIVGVIGGGVLGQVFLVPVWFQNPVDLQILAEAAPDWLKPLMTGPAVPLWIGRHPHLHGFAVSIAGLIVGGGVVWTVRIIGFFILRREAMGFGDVTLMAAVGSFLGWQPVLLVFFVAPFCAIFVAIGSLVLRRGQEIPYGPYLSLATLVVLLGWQRLWPAAEHVFQLGVLMVVFVAAIPILLAVCLVLVQLAKRAVGVELYPPPEEEWIEEWRSADQLSYQAGENIDERQGRWPAEEDRWNGSASGQGMQQEYDWRDG